MVRGREKLGSSFGWLNSTQFLGVFNDNVFQMFLIFCLIDIMGADKAGNITAAAGIVFVVPFLLLTSYAGRLADRFSKRDIIVVTKFAEFVIMAAGCVGFALDSPVILYAVLFLMGAQSAFFGPCKYGIMPELLETHQLSRGNSLLEGMTYLAIVAGAGAGPVITRILSKIPAVAGGGRTIISVILSENYLLCGLFCVVVALAGAFASLRIKRTRVAGDAGGVSVFFLHDLWQTMRGVSSNRQLFVAVFAGAYFLILAAFIKMNLIPYGMQRFGMDQVDSGLLFLPAAVGVGAGSWLAGRLSGRYIEFGIVPLGAVMMAITTMIFGLVHASLYMVWVLVFAMGAGGGLFIVPINAYIQLKSPAERRGRIIAAYAFIGWVGVALAAVLVDVCNRLWHGSAVTGFVLLGILTAVLAVVTVIVMTDFLFRLFIILLTRTVYRVEVVGEENIPSEGGVLMVSNHVSWVDSLLVGSAVSRRVRFVMERQYYDAWPIRWLCRLMRAIPISPGSPKKVIRAVQEAQGAIERGEIVCIFAEGALTRTGIMRQFKSGFEKMVKGSGCSVVPVYIGGAWGSVFSHYHGKIMSTLPRRLRYPVSIHFGEPMPAESSAWQIRQAVTELSCEYFESLKHERISLGGLFARTARKHWNRYCISDTTGKRFYYGSTLAGAVALADKIGRLAAGQERVGILLAPSVGAVVSNLAITLAGKVSVNLNYTASPSDMLDAIAQSGVRVVISSRQFIRKANIEAAEGIVYLEDILAGISRTDRLRAFIRARFMPLRHIVKMSGFDPDNPVTIIFSSGSCGKPKGVVLSHHNIISNIEAARMVFRVYPSDNLCGVLPFFHSFGYSFALWLPLLSGASAVYVPNPLDASKVGEAARENRSTILFAVPTFLETYIRRVEKGCFAWMREVIVGAEKLKKQTADAFEQKFCIKPHEGYGATELSPVVSLNLADIEVDGVRQVGTKQGSVGHPLPGIAVKVVDPQTYQPVGVDEQGLLFVKGPNVMLGYLDKPQETARVLKDGWYNTGDIAVVDSDGFIIITDRLSRFSKIGGEMVGHLCIEDICMRHINSEEQVVAVTSIPDDRKGEELVVLYVEKAADAGSLYRAVSESELPNICKPKRENFIPVEAIPVLGSGKLDLMTLKQMALRAKGADCTR